MAAIYWLIAFVVLVGIEIMTTALTTIWFAGGVVIAFVAALLGAAVAVQLLVFVVISFLMLFLTRRGYQVCQYLYGEDKCREPDRKRCRSNGRGRQHKRDRCRYGAGPGVDRTGRKRQ